MIALVLASACAAPLRITAPYCAPPASELALRLPAGEALPNGSNREAQLAALLGLSDALEQRSRGPLPEDARLDVLTRIDLARLEISAITAELDCEGERSQQAADYLAQRQARTVQRVTVASILTATVVGVASVLLSTKDAAASVQDAVGITGAAAAAGTGFATLYVAPTLRLESPRNMLRDIREGPTSSSIYPPVVWAYLSRAGFSNAQDAPIRTKLIERFCRLNGRCDDDTTVRLVFGAGGEFDADTLRQQAALLDQVKAEVDLENQDLRALAERLLL